MATCTTVPGKPSSATTRLLPPPSTSSGSPRSIGGPDRGDDLRRRCRHHEAPGRAAEPQRGVAGDGTCYRVRAGPVGHAAPAVRAGGRPRGPGSAPWPRRTGRSAPARPGCRRASPRPSPLTSMVAPASSSGTTTGAENRTPNSTTAPGSPAQSVTYRPAWAMVNMPCAMTSGRPTDRAIRSFQWMTLKSPDAPQYLTRSEPGHRVGRPRAARRPTSTSAYLTTALTPPHPPSRVPPASRRRCTRARRPRSGSRSRVVITALRPSVLMVSIVDCAVTTSPARSGRA